LEQVKKHVIDLGSSQTPILDIASYGRAAPRSFTASQRALIASTVNRSPEVMVKVSGGARSVAAVGKHLAYIGSDDFVVETDMGERIQEAGFEKALMESWDLDLEAYWHQSARSVNMPRRPVKLVHNLIFSMPSGTPAAKVLQAVRRFATNEWALKHRYALVLHTNEPHPHVHVVVKAMSEQSKRLNIRKATLRDWRQQFAANLRDLGVAANATERAVRGQSKSSLPDAVYRAANDPNRESTYLQKRATIIYNDLRQQGHLAPEQGKEKMLATWRAVEQGWRETGLTLAAGGDQELAERVQRFVDQMPRPKSGTEMLFQELLARHSARKIQPDARTL
jgi:type IV secretory pathway VirD2 relaxase